MIRNYLKARKNQKMEEMLTKIAVKGQTRSFLKTFTVGFSPYFPCYGKFVWETAHLWKVLLIGNKIHSKTNTKHKEVLTKLPAEVELLWQHLNAVTMEISHYC